MNPCTPPSSFAGAGSPWWVDVGVYLTAASALAFVVAYARLAPWRSTVMGRHVMTFMAVILIVASLAVASTVFGTSWPYRNAVRAGAWYAVAGSILWRIWLLAAAQRGARVGHPRPD